VREYGAHNNNNSNNHDAIKGRNEISIYLGIPEWILPEWMRLGILLTRNQIFIADI